MIDTESLDIDLKNEAEVEYILKQYPNLKYLNGHPVNPADFVDDSSREEPLIENSTTSKPEESIQQIKEEDNEDEPLEAPPVDQLPSEKPRSSLRSHRSEASSGSQEYSDSEEINLKPKDLESIALIFDKIRNLHRKNRLSNDKEMAAEFDTHLKSWMQDLSDIILSNDININKKNSAILKTKFDLGQICYK